MGALRHRSGPAGWPCYYAATLATSTVAEWPIHLLDDSRWADATRERIEEALEGLTWWHITGIELSRGEEFADQVADAVIRPGIRLQTVRPLLASGDPTDCVSAVTELLVGKGPEIHEHALLVGIEYLISQDALLLAEEVNESSG